MKTKILLFVIAMTLTTIGTSQLGKSISNYSLGSGDSEVGKALNVYLSPTFSHGVGVVANVDFEIPMITDNLTLAPSLGIGVATYSYNYWTNNNFYGYNSTGFKSVMVIRAGVVAHYYFDWLIPNMPEKYDVFAKVRTGAIFTADSDVNVNPFDVSAQVGGRYNFSSKASLYGAVGYGHSYINVGLSFKL